jgi:hypothetical protein
MSFVPRSNGQTSLSTRCYGPGRWVPTASRGIRRALARTPPSTSSSCVWLFPRCCHRFGNEVLEPRTAPTSSFRTTSPVCSAAGLASLLHLAADPGVPYVSTYPSVEPAPEATSIAERRPLPVTAWRSSRMAFPTPRRSSLPRSRVASLRPLPPRTFHRHRSATLAAVAVSSAVSSCRIDGMRSLEALLRG